MTKNDDHSDWVTQQWRRETTGPHGETIEIPGAQITDCAAGLSFWVTAARRPNGSAKITYLAISADQPGQQINTTLLRSLPIADIAEETIRWQAARPRQPGERPDPFELARQYERHPRLDLARMLGTSPATLDRWVREARQQGYLPPAKRGRPAKKTQPEKESH